MNFKLIDLLCGASYTRYDAESAQSYQHRLVDDELHARAILQTLERAGIELPNSTNQPPSAAPTMMEPQS